MYEALKDSLRGCVYTVFTPFDAYEEIDYAALERYLDMLFRQGATKFYVMAYNSRYSQLRNDEIMRLNEFVAGHVKRLSPRNVVIVGDPIHCSTRQSVEFARHARDSGADLISLIFREKYFDDEQVLEHFATVGREARLPVLVHEMPFLSGYDGTQMHWPISLFEGLRRIEQIVALKEDAKSFETTCAALALEPRIRVIIAGRKSSLLAYRNYGVSAYLNGISMLDARIGEAFWSAWQAGDEATMNWVVEELEAPFFDGCVARYGWHRTNKALLQAAGLMHRRDRMPLRHLSDSQYADVEAVHELIAERISARFGE